MTKDEALKLALEALEEAWYHVGTFQPTEKAIDLYDAPEPDGADLAERIRAKHIEHSFSQDKMHIVMPEQKHMHPQLKAMLEEYFDKCFAQSALQRTWVGLTYEEQRELYKKHEMDGWGHFYNAIEAKLKEKNT